MFFNRKNPVPAAEQETASQQAIAGLQRQQGI